MSKLSATPLLMLLAGCSLFDWPFNELPPLPSQACVTFIDITAMSADDGGEAAVTVGCNQAPGSACDGGEPPACPTSTCIEVDWAGVSATFNGNCSSAMPFGLASAAACVDLAGDSGVVLSFQAKASVPTPFAVYAHESDAGVALGCTTTCAQAAINCLCDAALSGTSDQSCAELK